ncbi:MAG: acyl carrier protein [Legionellales bacterium]|jgi:acyl carrier protein|nr:acyl carrier protein [Legionellales bacterium]
MTSKENIKDKVLSIIADQLDLDKSTIKMESSFVDDLGADSLDTVELVLALEEEFEVNIPDEEAEKITTVKQAVEKIEAHFKDGK